MANRLRHALRHLPFLSGDATVVLTSDSRSASAKVHILRIWKGLVQPIYFLVSDHGPALSETLHKVSTVMAFDFLAVADPSRPQAVMPRFSLAVFAHI